MRVRRPFIINLACTGIIPTRDLSPHVPLSQAEIVEDVARCQELGVQMVHLHARDADGAHSADPDRYGRLIEAIRALPGGRDLVVCVTTSGRLDSGFAARSRVLDLDGAAKPDMASLTLSSLNFVQGASVNEPATIRKLAERMRERGIKPELEVFDSGMANVARVLVQEGLVAGTPYVNVLLGNIAGAQTDLIQVAAILAALPTGSVVALAGLGKFQLEANGLGLLVADGVRVGLEDNIWLDGERTVPASNAALVERVIRQAALLERRPMTPAELRRTLGLPPGPAA
jgi:uncharacterized protein (DUF849 family)